MGKSEIGFVNAMFPAGERARAGTGQRCRSACRRISSGSISSHSRRRNRWSLRPGRSPYPGDVHHPTVRRVIGNDQTLPHPWRKRMLHRIQLRFRISRGRRRFLPVNAISGNRLGQQGLELAGFPCLFRSLREPRLRSFADGEFAKNRHLQEDEGASHQLGKCQQIEEFHFPAAEKSHCSARLWSPRQIRKEEEMTRSIHGTGFISPCP